MRDDDLSSMLRAVLKPDGTTGLLSWLARRLDARTVLLDCAGKSARAFPDCPSEVLRDVAGDIKRVISGTCAAASICGPSWWARLVGLGGGRGGPALLVTGRTPLTPEDGALIAHAAALLQLCWPAEVRDEAITQIREAVPRRTEALPASRMSWVRAAGEGPLVLGLAGRSPPGIIWYCRVAYILLSIETARSEPGAQEAAVSGPVPGLAGVAGGADVRHGVAPFISVAAGTGDGAAGGRPRQ